MLSLMSLGRIALETIDDAGLRRSERHPLVRETLQREEELLDAVLHLRMEIVLPVELGLERILADERRMVAPGPPQPQVVLGDDPFAKVELPEVEEHFLYDGLVHELDGVR